MSKHTEKVTFYCTLPELLALDEEQLKLRAEAGIKADRGAVVRAALEVARQRAASDPVEWHRAVIRNGGRA